MLRLGRLTFWALLAAGAVTLQATLGQLPPRIASHFDLRGAPNAWSSHVAYAGLLVTIGGLLPLVIVAGVSWLSRRRPDLLNVPAREYWQRAERRDEAARRVGDYMWWIGCLMTGTAIAIHLLILRAHAVQSPRLETTGLVAVLAIVLLGLGAWIGGWYVVMRPPAADDAPRRAGRSRASGD